MEQQGTSGRTERVRTALQQRFSPRQLEIEDESARHAGHAGVQEAGGHGETHYAVRIVATAFAGLNRMQRSRLVHAALAEEFKSGLHALSLTLRAPDEP
ncbi:BolA family protein [Lichenicoccus sp.]|uniref:BolA family protein n=1 Tax=Lichenicoccus sp. TaxID=2781899 RepID=UPI003D10BCB6